MNKTQRQELHLKMTKWRLPDDEAKLLPYVLEHSMKDLVTVLGDASPGAIAKWQTEVLDFLGLSTNMLQMRNSERERFAKIVEEAFGHYPTDTVGWAMSNELQQQIREGN